MVFKQVIPVTTNSPVTLAELKQQLRLTTTAEDDLLNTFLSSAKKEVEGLIGMSIDIKTIVLSTRCFQNINILPDPPIVDGSLSVSYTNENGAEQTLSDSNYKVVSIADDISGLFYSSDAVLPSVKDSVNAVKVTYNVGFLQVPDDIKIGIKMIAAEMFEFRSDRPYEATDTRVMRLLRKYRQYA